MGGLAFIGVVAGECVSNAFARLTESQAMYLATIIVFGLGCSVGFAAQPGWSSVPGGRAMPLSIVPGKDGFRSLGAESTGIYFTNVLAPERHLTNQILLNGSGVAAGDVDGDGLPDLYFCALDGSNKLFRNLGSWRFEEMPGPTLAPLDATGAAFADLDGDSDLDLVVNSVGGGTYVLLNDGKARFASQQVLNQGRGGMSLAFADIEGDGDVDLYIANYRTVTIRDQPNTAFNFKTINQQPTVVSINGRPLTDPDLTNRFEFRVSGTRFSYEENGEPDALFINDGKGRFTPAPATTFPGEEGNPLDWGLSVMFRDLNQDGTPDIYVCNDFKSPDRIWFNNGKGQFRPAPPLTFRQISLSSMGVDVADINGDGHDDLFVVDMLSRNHERRHQQRIDIRAEPHVPGAVENRPQVSRNTLFLNRGDGTYAEVARLSGLDATEWSWTPIFLDVDLDGHQDVLISTGFERDNMNVDVLRQIEAAKKEQKLSAVEQLHLRSMFPRLDTPNLAFRNLGNLQFTDHSQQWRFSAQTISQGMALADLDNDGDQDVVINNLNGPAGIYRNEGSQPRLAVRLKGKGAIGARISVSGGPTRQAQEILAGGRYLSSDAPARTFACGNATVLQIEVRWRNGLRSVLTNAQANHLYELDEAAAAAMAAKPTIVTPPYFEDASALLRHVHEQEPTDEFGQQTLLPFKPGQLGPGVAWTGARLCVGGAKPACFQRNDGSYGIAPVPAGPEPGLTSAPLAVTPQHTFIAGLPLAQRFPESAPSTLNGKSLADLGHISGAVFTDLDGDGDSDLVVASNPGSLKVLENKDGQFADATKQWGLDAYSGFWNGVTSGDFNGDGRMDLAASNLGLNSDYRQFVAQDLMVFYADFDGNGCVEWIEGYRNGGRLLPIQPFYTTGVAMPWLRERMSSFAAYSRASLEEIHADNLKKANRVAINWLPSTVFLNRGQLLEPKPLPIQAQFAPAFGVCVSDFDGDGHEDIFLSQNLFAVPAETSRYDGGRGLWLRGGGDGSFVAEEQSGIKIYGEQRGAATGDYDGDGRTDIVVAQNAGPTRLYRNARGNPGLRIILSDPIGAVLRLKNGERLGPAREIHAGSGFRSRDDAIQVLHGAWATHVEVRRPGQGATTHEIPKGARELKITR